MRFHAYDYTLCFIWTTPRWRPSAFDSTNSDGKQAGCVPTSPSASSRRAAHVIKDDYRPPEKSPLKAFNEGLEAEMKVGDGNRLGELRKIFGDQIRNDDGVIRWRQELIREAFNSNKPFVIRLGEATPSLLSKLPGSVPAQSCAGKSLTVDNTWLDRKREGGGTHRDHFYPLENDPRNIPLTIENLELIPSIWREPDSVSDKTSHPKTRILIERKALHGGIYKMVVDVANKPYLVTLYKNIPTN